MALTQSQMIAAVADRADMSKADAKRALDALDEIVLQELGNAQKVRLGGLVQLTVRPSLSTSGETLTIEESVNLEGENGERRNVGDEHEWSCARG